MAVTEAATITDQVARPGRVTIYGRDSSDGTLRPVSVGSDGQIQLNLTGEGLALDVTLDGLERAVANGTATIANGASLSDAVALGNGRVCGIQMPSAWTAAGLTFQGSVDGGSTYQNIYDGATERLITSAAAVASVTLSLDGRDWAAFTHIKIRSGTSGTPVNQGGSRALVCALERGV